MHGRRRDESRSVRAVARSRNVQRPSRQPRGCRRVGLSDRSAAKRQRADDFATPPRRKESSIRRCSTRRNAGIGTPHESSDTSPQNCSIIVTPITGTFAGGGRPCRESPVNTGDSSRRGNCDARGIRHVRTGYFRTAMRRERERRGISLDTIVTLHQRQPRTLERVRVQRLVALAEGPFRARVRARLREGRRPGRRRSRGRLLPAVSARRSPRRAA